MTTEEKKQVWDVFAETHTKFRVDFGKEVTVIEALDLFNMEEFVDILDEETIGHYAYEAN